MTALPTPPAPAGAEVRRGILRAWNAGAYTADVQIDGSLLTELKGVPVARDIAGAEMTAGRKVAVAMFDPTNPADAVVLAVWT
jgi:hypothetical protein